MRHLLVGFVAALCVNVQAEELPEIHAAGFKNNAGGMTIITDRSFYCGNRGMYDGYAFGSNGQYARFCWVEKSGGIMAVYEDGEIRAYSVKSFELLEKEPEVKFNQP